CLISSAIDKSFNHCSLYKVTGKRPIPYTDKAPFSLTFMDKVPRLGFFKASFSAFRRSISALKSSDMNCSSGIHLTNPQIIQQPHSALYNYCHGPSWQRNFCLLNL